MSNKMKNLSPGLCTLFDGLLEANPALSYKRNWARRKAEAGSLSRQQKKEVKATDGDIDMDNVTGKESRNVQVEDSDDLVDDSEEYWKLFDQQEIHLIDDEDNEPEWIEEVVDEQQSRLKTIVRPKLHAATAGFD
jgi:hypothetical protein